MREKEETTVVTTRLEKTQQNQNHELYPIVGYFPSGFDSASQPPPHRINVLRHEKHNKRLQIVISLNEDSKVDFVGTSFSGEGATPQLCDFVVGVFDKDALTLKFVPLPANKGKKNINKMREKEEEEEEITVVTTRLQKTQQNQNHELYPIVGYFPSGFDSASQPPPHRINVLRHEKHNKRLQIVISPNEDSKVDFVGTSFSGEGATPQLCDFVVGVFDKDALTLKFVPLPANKIFRLEPKIAGLDVCETEPSKEESTAENKAEQKKSTNEFSGKAAKNRERKRKALRQNDDAGHQNEDLDKKTEEINKNQEAIEIASALHTNMPPFDLSATTKEMAYPLNNIILAGEWDFLLDVLALSDSEQDLTPEDYPSFVRNRVHLLAHNKDEEERKKLACIFSYITHLIKFKDKHSMDGVASAKYHRLPPIIQQKFGNMFAPSDNKRLPEEKKSLLISYLLVLTLFVDEFDTNPSDIAKDLRMSELKIRPYFEHLGCKKHMRQGNLKFELRVPLEFPKTRSKRRKR